MFNQPVNVYFFKQTIFVVLGDSIYIYGLIEEIYDGFGFRDKNGNVTWYEGYEPKDDNSHSSIIIPYGNGIDLKEVK